MRCDALRCSRITDGECLRQPALVTYVTAGYPTAEETPAIMLAMEKGGAGELFPLSPGVSLPLRHLADTHPLFADVIELGVPFTDPIADGPTIQTANTVRDTCNGTITTRLGLTPRL